jgi:murein DD-endopeptidase MepM/ murein hydrolase activator NlpD
MKPYAIGMAAIALSTGMASSAPSRPAVDRPRSGGSPAADTEAPIVRLLAAVQTMARSPAIATLVQPGSIDDMIHVRAVLAGMRSGLASGITGRRHGEAPGRASPYRLPVTGQLVTGFGTVSEAGMRSRGLTFEVPPGAPVVAPRAGVVRYAQAFRGYGGTVIVDHGGGWTSVLTGLGPLAVRPGDRVRGGTAIGTARRGGRRQVTVELRRHGEPVDAAPLIH